MKNLKEMIIIDSEFEPCYGHDEAYVNAPFCFPTVTFRLKDTDGLCHYADSIRVSEGLLPMYPNQKGSKYDPDLTYEFFCGLNGFTGTHVDTCIEFISMGKDFEETLSSIPLESEDQTAMYEILDEQCRRLYGKDCETLLREAEEMMDQDEQFEKTAKVVSNMPAKTYIVQIRNAEETYVSILTPHEIIRRIDMSDCSGEDFCIFVSESFGTLEPLVVHGCWHDPHDPLYIKVTRQNGEIMFDGYGTDH